MQTEGHHSQKHRSQNRCRIHALAPFGRSQIGTHHFRELTLLLPIGIFALWTYYKAGHVDSLLAVGWVACGLSIFPKVFCVRASQDCSSYLQSNSRFLVS